jgi:hypothetical protein
MFSPFQRYNTAFLMSLLIREFIKIFINKQAPFFGISKNESISFIGARYRFFGEFLLFKSFKIIAIKFIKKTDTDT